MVIRFHFLVSLVVAIVATAEPANSYLVPNIVHQIYDYHSPSFFLYLSIMCVQRFIQPTSHYLWVNDGGRFRKGQWEAWQANAKPDSWEGKLSKLIESGKITPKMLSFAAHPPGNESIFVSNKAHQSDFVRMEALKVYGGSLTCSSSLR